MSEGSKPRFIEPTPAYTALAGAIGTHLQLEFPATRVDRGERLLDSAVTPGGDEIALGFQQEDLRDPHLGRRVVTVSNPDGTRRRFWEVAHVSFLNGPEGLRVLRLTDQGDVWDTRQTQDTYTARSHVGSNKNCPEIHT